MSLGAFFFNKQFAFSLSIAVSVWVVWYILGGQLHALNNLLEHWDVALTMAFGSFVAGATSEGGGAVAFNQAVILYSLIAFISFFGVYYRMSGVKTYLPSAMSMQGKM